MRSRAVKQRDDPVVLLWLSAVGGIMAMLSQGDVLGAGSLECLSKAAKVPRGTAPLLEAPTTAVASSRFLELASVLLELRW